MKRRKKGPFLKRAACLVLAAAIVAGAMPYVSADASTDDPADPNEPTLQSVLTVGGSSGMDAFNQVISTNSGYAAIGITESKDGDMTGNPIYNAYHWAAFLFTYSAKSDGTPDSITNKFYYGSGSASAQFNSITRTSDGKYYIVAGYEGDAGITDSANDQTNYHGSNDAIVAKIDASTGAVVWIKYWGGTGTDQFNHVSIVSDTIIAEGVTYSSDGDISQRKGSEDGVAVAYDLAGNKKWQTQIGGSASSCTSTSLSDLTTDQNGNIYITGSAIVSSGSEGTGDFATKENGGEALSQCLTRTTSYANNGFVAKLNPSDGTVQWIQAGQTIPSDSITMADDHTLMLTGSRSSSNNVLIYGGITTMDLNGNIEHEHLLTGEVGAAIGGGSAGASDMEQDFDALGLTGCVKLSDGTYVGVSSSCAGLAPDSSDTDAQGSEYDVSGKNHLVTTDALKLTDDAYLIKFDANGNIYWIQNLGGTGVDTANSVIPTPDGGYVVAGTEFSMDGDFTTNHVFTKKKLSGTVTVPTQDGYFAKFSVDIDSDGDGVPNNRDAYPNDATKSADPGAAYDFTASPKLTFTGTGSACAKWGDLYSYLLPMKTRAECDFKATDNVFFNLGNGATVTAPFAALDAAIGADKTDALTFTYGSATVNDTTDTTYASPFTLSAALGSKAVTSLAAKVRVTVPLSNDVLSKISDTSKVEFDRIDSSTPAKVDATIDKTAKTITFDTDTLGTYALSAPAAQITADPYTTTETNKSITVTAHVTNGTFADGTTTATHTFDSNDSYTFEATNAMGVTASKTVTISNIKTTGPTITLGSYDGTTPTNKDITVTATTDSDATLNATSHTFTENGSFSFVATDTAGNTTTKTVTIANIDKTAPAITLGSYNSTAPTNKDITVTATTDSDATLNAASHTFTANGSFDFVATDKAGNVTTKTVTITNIDKTAPAISIGSYDTTPTTKSVTVTATTDSDATLNATSHTFTANGSFDFVATDKAGNVTTKTVTVSNILTSLSGGTSDGTVAVDAPVASLPDGVTSVSVQENTAASGSSTFSTVQTALGNQGYNILSVSNIELLDENGQSITNLKGKVTVKIKVPDGATGTLKVLWYNPSDGSVTDMQATRQDGYLVFQTNHFSYYAVAQATGGTSSISSVSSASNTVSTDTASSVSSEINPDTGGNTADPRMPLFAGLAATIAAACVALLYRRRSRHSGR